MFQPISEFSPIFYWICLKFALFNWCIDRCTICSRYFDRMGDLTNHLSWHRTINAERYKCDECQRVFKSNYCLEKHKETHVQVVKTLSCTQCDRKWVIGKIEQAKIKQSEKKIRGGTRKPSKIKSDFDFIWFVSPPDLQLRKSVQCT